MKYFKKLGNFSRMDMDNIACSILENNYERIGCKEEYFFNGEYFIFKDDKNEIFPDKRVTEINPKDMLIDYDKCMYDYFDSKSKYVYDSIREQAPIFFESDEISDITKLGAYLVYGGVLVELENGKIIEIVLTLSDYYRIRVLSDDKIENELNEIYFNELDYELLKALNTALIPE